MSPSGSGYDPDHPDDDAAGGHRTRTRLPEPSGSDAYGRRAPRPTKSMITVVGVVVMLLAAIAFANRGGEEPGGGDGRTGSAAQPTAPTGERPVPGTVDGIATGFTRTRQGAQSAAANYAVALGGDGMFQRQRRHEIVETVYTPEAAARLRDAQDRAYSAKFLGRLGLDADGYPPKGKTFVSRTVPVGTKLISFTGGKATVSVWYLGLIGIAGPGSTNPVSTGWHTWTFDLTWTGDGWKAVNDRQKDGPAPIPGDVPAASAEDISKAVKEFGGFTYAR